MARGGAWIRSFQSRVSIVPALLLRNCLARHPSKLRRGLGRRRGRLWSGGFLLSLEKELRIGNEKNRERLNCDGVNLVVFGVCADEADEDDACVVMDFYNESVVVALDVKDDAVVGDNVG